jgi:15-cis-phytoene desaturase
MEPYLGSMEGAVLSGKLTAQAIAQGQPPHTNSQSLTLQTRTPATNAATA